MADELFEDLTPPPGGLERLRETVELEHRRRVPWMPALATVAMAAVASFFVLTPRPQPLPAPTWTAADNPALARLGYAMAEESGLAGTAMRPEVVGGVRVYWLGGGPPSTPSTSWATGSTGVDELPSTTTPDEVPSRKPR